MTPEQRRLLIGLFGVPGEIPRSKTEEVLAEFGVRDGAELTKGLLDEAIINKSATDLELVFVAFEVYGTPRDCIDALIPLLEATWHHSHEEVVTAVGEIGSKKAVTALLRLTSWVPVYLEFDESRALARKAVHALGDIPGREARAALEGLLASKTAGVAEIARRQLMQRSNEL